MDKQKILIIEDDDSIRAQMRWALSEDYLVSDAADPESAMRCLSDERPALVLLDLGLPPHPDDTDVGFRLLGRILQHDPIVKVIIITANSARVQALRAISQGAHDFLMKPVDIEELKMILKRAFYLYSLEAEYTRLQKACESQPVDEMVGTSPKMQEIFSTVRKVAATDVPVLVTGESGTGKELIARAIHTNSLRKGGAFIPINCGAIPDALLESELFGHEKGSFTGAHIQRNGRIELAHNGTLFLDEIAELPLQLQVKVLRFLQDHKIERVGGRGVIDIDIRVIAATNKCVKKMISEEKFREDLFYRLAVVVIEVPPLRDRGEDILLLAKTFLKKYLPERASPKTLGAEAVDALNSYNWPGNVRELENRIRRAITFAEGPVIKPSDLGFGPMEETHHQLDLKKAKEELEVKFVNLAILKHNGNISRASEELGLSRPTVHHIIKKHNMLEAARKG